MARSDYDITYTLLLLILVTSWFIVSFICYVASHGGMNVNYRFGTGKRYYHITSLWSLRKVTKTSVKWNLEHGTPSRKKAYHTTISLYFTVLLLYSCGETHKNSKTGSEASRSPPETLQI
jgi:hypothetical protein